MGRNDEELNDQCGIDSLSVSECCSILDQDESEWDPRESSRGLFNFAPIPKTRNSARRERRDHESSRNPLGRKHRSSSGLSPDRRAKSLPLGTCGESSARPVLRVLCGQNQIDEVGCRNVLFENRLFHADDVSSLHCDEFGYDRHSPSSVLALAVDSRPLHTVNGEDDVEDDELSEFFRAPTPREFSNAVSRLDQPGGLSSPDARNALANLKQWGHVAEHDPVTARRFVDNRVAETLLGLVEDLMRARWRLREEHYRKHPHRCDDEDELITAHHRDFVDVSTKLELGLHQALQVLGYCCTSLRGEPGSSSDIDHPSALDYSPREAFLVRFVEHDGVQPLVGLLGEQLTDTRHATHDGTPWGTTIGRYELSVARSILGILLAVGGSGAAMRTLDADSRNLLVTGIGMGLNHRCKLGDHMGHDRDWMASRCVLQADNDNNDNEGIDSSTGLWKEDLFVALCRLVGSKDVDEDNDDAVDLHPYDEIRCLVLELCLVQKCLRILLDEEQPEDTVADDSFATTLALSFFYACLRFATTRYPRLQKQQQQRNKPTRSAEQVASESLDCDRLVRFTLSSLERFPSHSLIQGSGRLILQSMPESYRQFYWKFWRMTASRSGTDSQQPKHTLCPTTHPPLTGRHHGRATRTSPNNHRFAPSKSNRQRRMREPPFEPCSWYFPEVS